MSEETVSGRKVLRIGGSDRSDFLQGLVTNDLDKISDGLVYAAILNPQGKYLADFFLAQDGDTILLDVADSLAEGLARRLMMYKLRADVTITATDLYVVRGFGDLPSDGQSDPRHADLGWRAYRHTAAAASSADWDALRVRLGIPESGVELIPDETYILEAGFERLHGVDFRKGCYVGQEVTARMKHKTDLRKGIVTVDVDGAADPGTDILANGKIAGRLFSQSQGKGLAYLRFDRASGPMQAGDAQVSWVRPT